MEDKLVLKEFSEEQIDILYQWSNDFECRKNSFQMDPIVYETHVKWCYDILKSKAINLYIAYLKHIPVGQLRLKYEKSKVIISYSIDKSFRGLGLGQLLIEAIEEYKLFDENNVNELLGYVKIGNIASQKIFQNCKYEKNIEGDYLVYRKKMRMNKNISEI